MNGIETIGTQRVERVVQFRAQPGADLLETIEAAVRKENVRAAVIISGLGALRKAVFRNLRRFPEHFPVTPEDRLYREVQQPMELVSLSGWVATRSDGLPVVHAHFAASTVDGDEVVTLGGHLTRGTVCDIKVVVALLVVGNEAVYAAIDAGTKTADVFFGESP